MPTPPKLAISYASKIFKARQGERTALTDVTFDVPAGTIATVIGPTGCGKTTLLNLVAGFELPSSGQVLLDGNSIDRPGPDRAFMFQRPTLLPWLTVRANVEFPARQGRMEGAVRSRHDIRSTASEYLRLVGLEDAADLYPHQMSGGMQSRAALARLLIARSPVLLMDEPFGALDAQTRLTMQRLLMRIVRHGEQKTVLFITHDVEEALLISDDIYVMSSSPGRIIRHMPVPFRGWTHYADVVSTAAFHESKHELIDLLEGAGSAVKE